MMKRCDRLVLHYVRAFELCALYVIGPKCGHPVKIGYARNIGTRISTLRTGHWEEISAHHVLWCPSAGMAKTIEQHSHRMLGEFSMRGEWFAVPADVAVAAIQRSAEVWRTTLTDDATIKERAKKVVDRVEAEVSAMQQRGDMKLINQGYKNYRITRGKSGVRAQTYHEWLHNYKVRMLYNIAAVSHTRPMIGLKKMA